MYIGQVEYKMKQEDEWQQGWLVGEHIDNAKTLLDKDFKPVPPIVNFSDKGKEEFMCYDLKRLNFGGITIQV